ncbi:hypothetical protein ECAE60S_04566 [Eoetvoesiella caeni]
MLRKFSIICALGRYQLLTTRELEDMTGIADQTIKRQIAKINDEFKMNISYQRGSGARGKSGYYSLTNWGVIDKEEFMLVYGNLVK